MSRGYRALVRLYPRSFRDEYGDDLVALFEDQRAADGASRTWRRAARDLLVSVPTQHLEVIVHHRSPRFVSSVITVVGALALVTGVALGSMASPLILLVGGALTVGGAMSWQQHRDVAAPSIVDAWWKVLLAGPALLVSTAVLHAIWPASLDLGGDVGWLLTFSSVIISISLIIGGLALAGVALVNRRPASR